MEKYTIGQWIEDNNIDTTTDINCDGQNITSLEGLPEGFNSIIDCSFNNLTSLEGLPEGFNSSIYCSANRFTSLEGITKLEVNNLHCDWSKGKIEKEYLRLGLSSLLV